MKRYILLLLLSCTVFMSVNAYEKRDLLQHNADLKKVRNSLIFNQKWVAYPKYSDRVGWDKLTGAGKADMIRRGEAVLNYPWKAMKATDYLEYDRTGSRKAMEDPARENINAISSLVLAELAEGKGRFIDQIVNGVHFYCEMTAWSPSAHLRNAQSANSALPSYKENIIDLTSGDMGAFFAWTYYFLKPELDKVHPLVAERLRDNLQRRILDSYIHNSNFWWQAFNATPATMVNNWNPWCNSSVLTCFLLLENDPDKLAAAVYRSMVSTDKFINYYHADGACEEGPSYWGHAPGKLYDYLQLLSTATGGKISLFDQPLIRNMGEYIARSYVGNGWVVNFADASARGGGDIGLVYRFGRAVGSREMQQYASALYQQTGKKEYYNDGRDLFRTLENLTSHSELLATPAAFPNAPFTWYPETEFCYLRNQTGFFLAAKGGYNAESHNHNDMGSFILYVNSTPLIIDAGVGAYTRKTFSNERYTIWTMQSDYHNLPLINGVSQAPGAEFRSRNVQFDPRKLTFSLDLAGAYPKEAALKSWHRSYQLGLRGGLIITDRFSLTRAMKPNVLNFLTASLPDIHQPGVVTLQKDSVKLKIAYNPAQFEPLVETIPLADKNLINVWGTQIYRLSLKARKMPLADVYTLKINTYK